LPSSNSTGDWYDLGRNVYVTPTIVSSGTNNVTTTTALGPGAIWDFTLGSTVSFPDRPIVMRSYDDSVVLHTPTGRQIRLI
jgi:hypothetical protein